MKTFILQNLTGKKVLLFFIFTNIVYAFMLLVSIPYVMKYSEGMKLLDMLPTGYTYDYVTNLWEKLGEEGQSAYLYYQLPIDMVYPALFAISYSLILSYFLNKMSQFSTFYGLVFIPVFAGVMDYLENVGLISMLISQPTTILVQLTSGFSVLKSMSTTLYFVILMIVLLCVLFQFIKQQFLIQKQH